MMLLYGVGYLLVNLLVAVLFFRRDWKNMRQREKPSDIMLWYAAFSLGLIWFAVVIIGWQDLCVWVDKKFAYKEKP